MAFLTIIVAPNLTPSQRRQAELAGPPAVLARHDHVSMLSTAGFRDIEETDVTPDYLRTVRAWFGEASAREAELRAVMGDVLFEERQSDRRIQTSAIESGLLRRSLYVAATG